MPLLQAYCNEEEKGTGWHFGLSFKSPKGQVRGANQLHPDEATICFHGGRSGRFPSVESVNKSRETVEESGGAAVSCCGKKRGKLISSEGQGRGRRTQKGKESEKRVWILLFF